ncbi:type IV pilus assembly protein PilM [Orenia marismortui]|uniref:type IV pilus assembly protein PilM n=1 Tax=Orenia marismortui TaxID=46469 RepID=UPI0003681735|nr:type IV pilus assembly protein PilM [Orenia marismortui]
MGIFSSLKKKINLLNNKNVIGLDIGEESIKITEVQTVWGRIVLNSLALIPTPEDAVIEGDIKNLSLLEEKINEALDENEFEANRVITAVSGEQVISRMVDIPAMPEDDLDEAIKWEARDKLPIDVEESIVDYEILNKKDDGGYQILIIAVKKDLIDKYLKLFEALELIPVAIEIEPVAIARTVDKLYMDDTIGVIDIGTKTTDISIINRGRLLFTRTVGMGGENITQDISETSGISLEKAEEYKKDNDLFKKEESNLIVRNLTTAIYRSLDYFQVKYKSFDIDRIVLTGGGGNLINFDRHLTKEFGVRVEKLNLSNRLRSELASEDYLSEVAQLLGVSIGLASRKEDDR